MKESVAQLNYLHIAPRKVRLIANTLRGLSIIEAEAQLLLRPQRSVEPLLKLLRSAVANAKNNDKMNADKLVISRIFVDQGPMMKRMLPRAMGRATPIQKKMSHITIALAEKDNLKPARFTITPPEKKQKKEEKPGNKNKRPAAPRGSDTKPTSEKPKDQSGFLKRVFQRKSV